MSHKKIDIYEHSIIHIIIIRTTYDNRELSYDKAKGQKHELHICLAGHIKGAKHSHAQTNERKSI